MVERDARRVALMAIQPRFSQAILEGKKLVEFRKRPLAADIRTVMIYQSSPTQMIVGSFEIGEMILATPNQLWERFGGVGSIGHDDLMTYYAGTRRGVALRISSSLRFLKPVALASLSPRPAIPQSFSYLDDTLMNQALSLACAGSLQSV